MVLSSWRTKKKLKKNKYFASKYGRNENSYAAAQLSYKNLMTFDMYTHEGFNARRRIAKRNKNDKNKKNMRRMSKAVFFCIFVLAFHSLLCQPGLNGLSIAGTWFRAMLQCPQCFKKMKKRAQVLKKVKRLSGHSCRRRISYRRLIPRIG